MANKWVEFVKEWAKKNNTTYGCALSKPECSAEYKKQNTKPVTKEQSVQVTNKPKPVTKEQSVQVTNKPRADKYPSLMEGLIKKSKEFNSQVKEVVENFRQKIETTGTNKKEREKYAKTQTDLMKKLNELRKIGRDNKGNLFLKESHEYFKSKYGENYAKFHPTAKKDKYWGDIDLLLPIWDETEKLIKDLSIFG